jgi:nucleoside-diphosphate-sugar epimerase
VATRRDVTPVERHDVLVTGANGLIGTLLRRTLRQPDRHLRLLDIAAQPELQSDEDATLIEGSFLDVDLMDEACEGVEAIIHLGGLSTGGHEWREYLEVNINGTREVLDAARRAQVPRVIYASSHHAVGFHPSNVDDVVPDYLYPQPDSFYGVSKVAGESLCSLYHDRYGLDTICLRIGSFRERPIDRRTLWSWLSPGDCTRLFEASLRVPSPGFRVVWGVSANTRGIVSMHEANDIGYFPIDNAEEFAHEIVTDNDDDDGVYSHLMGGRYAAPTFE